MNEFQTLTAQTADDDDLATALRALSHPARLQIMRFLSEPKSRCCGDVTQCLSLAQSTVSQHLKVLLDAGLIACRPEGTRNCYVIVPDKVSALREAMFDVLGTMCLCASPDAGTDVSDATATEPARIA